MLIRVYKICTILYKSYENKSPVTCWVLQFRLESIAMYRGFIGFVVFAIYLASQASAQFMARQHTVKDLQSGTTWLRCSVGQAWDPALDTCTGDIVKLDHAQVEYAISEAKRQLGGNWRLPTRQELESLVCEECTAPKINSKYFPKISPEAYWTSDKNTLNPKTFWSVNFMTGHSYSRFFPYQSLPVLLVSAD